MTPNERMNRCLERQQEEKAEKERLMQTPTNRRLKYTAIGVMGVGICLLLSMIIWFDEISPRTQLFMRGCVGVIALIFVIICAILLYRVNSQYLNNRHGNNRS